MLDIEEQDEGRDRFMLSMRQKGCILAAILLTGSLMTIGISGPAFVQAIQEMIAPPMQSSAPTEEDIREIRSSLSQIGWLSASPVRAPPGRNYKVLVYDSESDRMILFSGGFLNDTWAYDYNANTWTQMNPRIFPPPRTTHAMAYDSESDRIILFGGASGVCPNPNFFDTWAYDYNTDTWEDMSPMKNPPDRYWHSMTYDSESDRVILFGGMNCNYRNLGDTWVYDYNANTWTKMNPATAPPCPRSPRLCYIPESDRVILLGDGQTWAYDYNTDTWTNMNPPTGPQPRGHGQIVYDSRSGQVILFGGSDMGPWQSYGYSIYADTWAYDHVLNRWTEITPITGPSQNYWYGMAYDSESDMTILLGAGMETWGLRCSPGPCSKGNLTTLLLDIDRRIDLLKDDALERLLAEASVKADYAIEEGDLATAAHMVSVLDRLADINTSRIRLLSAREFMDLAINTSLQSLREGDYASMLQRLETGQWLGCVRETIQPLKGSSLLVEYLEGAKSLLSQGEDCDLHVAGTPTVCDLAQAYEMASWCNQIDVQHTASEIEAHIEEWPSVETLATEKGVNTRDLGIAESILEETKKQFLEGKLESSKIKLEDLQKRLRELGLEDQYATRILG